jgi:2-dehydropantoate 2-reductase
VASDNARILVIGAGVNGSVCTAWLSRSGVDVTVLARGQRLAVIQNNGIVIENPFTKRRTVTRVRAIGELAAGDIYDYILVVVRRNQVAGLLPMLAANRSPNVVFMNNNFAGPAEIVAALGPERPMLGFVFAGGKRDGDIIRAIGPFKHAPMRTPFGEIDGTITPRLKRLVKLLNGAGLPSEVSTQIVDFLAAHAAGVAAIVPLATQLAAGPRVASPSDQDLRLAAAAIRETHAVLKALGHKIVPASLKIVDIMPVSMLAFGLRLLFRSKFGEVGGIWHAQQAPDELQALADDLRAAVLGSSVPAPAIRKILDVT